MGILIIIVCVILSFVILIQNSKGGGLASNFSSSNQILDVAYTKDTIEQITWIGAGLLLLLCLLATPKMSPLPAKQTEKTTQTTEGAKAPAGGKTASPAQPAQKPAKP